MNETISKLYDCLLDSGASHHMVGNDRFFTNLRRLAVPIQVKTLNTVITVEYIGDVQIKPRKLIGFITAPKTLELKHVLYSNSFEVNLVSYSKLCKQYSVSSNNGTFKIGNICMVEADDNGLFPIGEAITQKANAFAGAAVPIDATILHRRFGHVGLLTLKKLAEIGKIKVDKDQLDTLLKGPPCETCMLAKHKQDPYNSSDVDASQILHTDVLFIAKSKDFDETCVITGIWEPCEHSFVTVCDRKSEAAQCVKKYIAFIEKQTGSKVRFVRSDRGREYINNELGSYFATHGIKHETSIMKTPQQNGKAERLNGVLMDKTRCLLMDSDLPQSLWVKAMQYANYLRNISICSKKFVPYCKFWNMDPDYLMLRIFGCRAYSWIHSTDRDHKLSATSELGMFVGLAKDSKGYEILFKDKDGCFGVKERRNVKFDETKTSTVF